MRHETKTGKKTAAGAFIAVFAVVLFSGFFLIGGVDKACAQPIAPTPCDPVYYDSLEARAWLEAQREITQNQNLIFKPDSVLEYTCFDRFANVLALEAINMFSETTRWGVILPANSMDVALTSMISGAMADYLTANFNHTFLGGRMPAGAGSTYTPAATVTGGAYNCDVMNRVWAYAKCMDFMHNPAEDGFFTFENYSTTPDKRYLPTRCAALGAAWTTAITNAGLDPLVGAGWAPDTIRTYTGWLDPANCADIAAYPPIDTGITVTRPKVDPTNYVERVCIIPGCHYTPPAGGGAAMGTCDPP